MTMIRILIVALFAVVVASCATPPKEKSETKPSIQPTENEVIRETQYLPGKVVVAPYPVPDSSLVEDADPLTEEFITGDDIEPQAVMDTAIAWSKQYHDLTSKYDTLRGWIIGVRAGQEAAGIGIDAPPVLMKENDKPPLTPE